VPRQTWINPTHTVKLGQILDQILLADF